MLYSMLNPGTALTVGRVNAEAHVEDGAVITGVDGNMTVDTVLLTPHDPMPAVPASVAPQSADST
jgi:hypothetical protein